MLKSDMTIASLNYFRKLAISIINFLKIEVMRKIITLSATLLAVLCTACSSSQESITQEQQSNVTKDIESLSLTSQRSFLYAVDSINSIYRKTPTRNFVEKFSKFCVLALADGLGGCVGSGIPSWFTSAAASYGYEKYLDKCKEEMNKRCRCNTSLHHRNVTRAITPEYEKIERDLAFTFCSNNPKNVQDSIGYAHNQILSMLIVKGEQGSSDTEVNYEKIEADCKQIFENLNYNFEEIENADKSPFYRFCEQLSVALNLLQESTTKSEQAFKSIEECLTSYFGNNAQKAKFVSLLSKYIAPCLSEDISFTDLQSYSKQLNAAIDSSELSEEDISTCKKLFQTAVCSYVFWKNRDAAK